MSQNLPLGLMAVCLLSVNGAQTQLQFDPTIVNNPTLGDTVGPGNRGPATLRAQILLDRANFSPGEIDGYYGVNMRNAVAALQKSRGLQETGMVGPETW